MNERLIDGDAEPFISLGLFQHLTHYSPSPALPCGSIKYSKMPHIKIQTKRTEPRKKMYAAYKCLAQNHTCVCVEDALLYGAVCSRT